MPLNYPFAAVVAPQSGQRDDMALALILTTISPEVGGVLVRGEKGTAKSTIVRALAGVLPPIEVYAGDRFSVAPGEESPDGPFTDVETRPVRLVELPVGATEDRVLGSLHLGKALGDGVAEYEPGLLARAHRGLLYVDEVNLLHDHLVDLLLDAAAMGRSSVERDGVSMTHPARFVLVGTMNPEEGELRPQLLDRFGLTVEVAAPRDPATRVEVVRRRMAFDADPAAFVESWAEEEARLTDRIVAARKLVGEVELTDAALMTIAELCAAFDVDGMRADIVTARAAAAHAAWQGRTRVEVADIRAAARLSLPHRRRRNPFDAPGMDEDLLDQVLGEDEPDPEPDPDGGPDGGSDGGSDGGPGEGPDTSPDNGPGSDGGSASEPTADAAGEQGTPPGVTGSAEQPSAPEPPTGTEPSSQTASEKTSAGTPYRPRLFTVGGTGTGEAGRRSRAVTENGRRVGARTPDGGTGPIHLMATLQAAAPHQHARGRTTGPVRFAGTDLRLAVREGRESNLVLFCVDASGSMAAQQRMREVKTAVMSLLLDAYRRRDKVGLVTFAGGEATLALPATHSVEVAAARLDDLPTGGRTPLAEGLLRAAETLRVEAIRDPRRRPLLVLVTDGRATHGADAVARSLAAADLLADVSTLVIDCETGRFRLGLARDLATRLGAEHVPLAEVTAEALTTQVRASVAAREPGRASGSPVRSGQEVA